MYTNPKDIIKRLFGRGKEQRPKPLARSTVTHDSVDKMVFENYSEDSPRLRNALDDRPKIPVDAPDPEAIDFTTATPDEIKAWQKEAREAKRKREQAPEYDAWEDLARDVFYGYHHPRDPQVVDEDIDPAVAAHAKIMSKMLAQDEFTQARNITRDDGVASAAATLASTRTLREALTEELIEQARQSEEFEQARETAEGAMEELESLRDEAKQQHADQGSVDPSLAIQIRDTVKRKREAQAQAADIAMNAPVPFDKAAHEAVVRAVEAGLDAAEKMQNIPSFGQGFQEGEPRYESPEQALSIAEMWTTNELLNAVAELYGRLDKDMRFERSKRVVGGQDEIVDVTIGDDLRRVVTSEYASLADDDMEDDFYSRYLTSELTIYSTVGEEHAGRGPIILVGDESMSMQGERLVWMKAMALCLLNISRREKRDFAYVGFASGRQVRSFQFPTRQAMDAQEVVEMASHFFNGGTTPIIGITMAVEIMDRAADFKKADIVIVSDGEAGVGPEDRRLRDYLDQKGVRIHGIGIGGSFTYLKEMATAGTVDIRDFDLTDPSEATAHLATHIT